MIRTFYSRADHLVHEMARFGVVGAVALVVNVSLFNLLRSGLDLQPIRSKVVATVLATVVAYVGNRHWTYKDRDRRHVAHESTLFFVFNGIGLMIESGCLALSHYALGLHSVLADNISGNGFGLVLGTLFRFWAYRRWVFLKTAEGPALPPEPCQPVGAGSP